MNSARSRRLAWPAAARHAFAMVSSIVLAGQALAAGKSDVRFDAVYSMGGQNAGIYSEETARSRERIQDTIEQDYVLNRLGSRIEIRSKEVDIEDVDGHLLGAHIESSSSKTGVVTDVVVNGKALTITTQSGGKSYRRSVPITGELLGPAGMRLLVSRIARTHRPARYQTFSPELGSIAEITLKPVGQEILTIERVPIETNKLDYRIAGIPTATTMWVDKAGYTVRAIQDSPFGPIEIERTNHPPTLIAGAELPAESYEKTIAVSNIRLPHPRRLQSVTVEITAKNPAGIEWPDFASSTQRVIAQTPRHVVLEIHQARLGAHDGSEGRPLPAYLGPNVLLQSDDSQVREIASSVSAGKRDPWQVTLALQRWVNENMHFDPGIAVAPASEVARDRHGTCLGYSILLASLARVEQIPSRLKLGYVYDGKMWGGHAWVEVLINGQWRPIDASEYAPGIADAARIEAITETGQSGTIEHVGELAKLYSKVDIRILAYRLAGRTVRVGLTAADHSVQGNAYDNPWIGLRVVKPSEASFSDLDGHWPDPTVLRILDGQSGAGILYTRTDADTTERALAAKFLTPLRPDGPLEQIEWSGHPAIRAHAKNKEAIVAIDGDVAWTMVSSGPKAHQLIEGLLARSTSSDPLWMYPRSEVALHASR